LAKASGQLNAELQRLGFQAFNIVERIWYYFIL
jgi:hypothetical protein